MKNFILTLVIIFSIVITSACPKQTDIDRAFDAIRKMSQITAFAGEQVAELEKGGVITVEQRQWTDAKLKIIRDGNARFLSLLEEIRKANGGKLSFTAEQKSRLDLFFNQEIIRHFTEILTEAGKLSPEQAKKILLAVAAVKSAILAISLVFGQGSYSYKFYSREVYNEA